MVDSCARYETREDWGNGCGMLGGQGSGSWSWSWSWSQQLGESLWAIRGVQFFGRLSEGLELVGECDTVVQRAGLKVQMLGAS